MLRAFLTNLSRYAAAVWVASMVVFVLLRIAPGDPAEIALGITATEETLAAKRAELGTDRPLVVQYFHWIGGIATGDFGVSLTSGQNISPLVADRAAVSLILVSTAMLLAVSVAIPLGTWAAMRRTKPDGAVITVASQIGVAVPSFLAAIVLVTVFAVHLGLLPANGWVPPADDPVEFISRLAMPAVALAAVQAAILTRYVRSAVLEILSDDFIRTARAKGLGLWQALLYHGLRNAALPVMTVAALQLAALVTGAVVIERVFVIPGLGSMLLDAVITRDLPVVQTIVMLLVMVTLAVNFAVEIAYTALDPRLRKESAR